LQTDGRCFDQGSNSQRLIAYECRSVWPLKWKRNVVRWEAIGSPVVRLYRARVGDAEIDEMWDFPPLAVLGLTEGRVVVLRDYEDMTMHRIAEILGTPAARFRTRLHRALGVSSRVELQDHEYGNSHRTRRPVIRHVADAKAAPQLDGQSQIEPFRW